MTDKNECEINKISVWENSASLPGKVLMQDKPGWRCNTFLHWRKELEFVYMIDGVLDAKISGENIQIKSGEFYFCNSEEIHITSAPDKDKVIKYIVVLLSNEYMRSFCDQIDRIQFKNKHSAIAVLVFCTYAVERCRKPWYNKM